MYKVLTILINKKTFLNSKSVSHAGIRYGLESNYIILSYSVLYCSITSQKDGNDLSVLYISLLDI